MPVIVRDAVASDHLVYAWPFPIGPEEHEVACADDELVVMCPSWLVGDRLGPGRHRWRTPDPTRPVAAYFVLTAPVAVSFDVITQFAIPTSGMPVRLRASGALHVRCIDPGLLVAQFVGLPFDSINEGVLRSVARSVERMLARLLTRRVVMAGTPNAVSDPAMLPNIVEELIAYNPTAGAVFGVELARLGHLMILADDGARPWQQMQSPASQRQPGPRAPSNGGGARGPEPNLVETARGRPEPAPIPKRAQTNPLADTSGEIVVKPPRKKKATAPGHAAAVAAPGAPGALKAGDAPPPSANRVVTTPMPTPRAAVSNDSEQPTEPDHPALPRNSGAPADPEARGAILGIGVSHVGSSAVASGEIANKNVSGEIALKGAGPAQADAAKSGPATKKIAPGGRVLVAGPDGLMQSAIVRQLLQGYYELEVGGSGETIWVPANTVVPE